MLITLALLAVSLFISAKFFYPYSIFSIKAANGLTAVFAFLFIVFPIVISIYFGNLLEINVGKNLPTFQKKIGEEYFSDGAGKLFLVEEYETSFYKWQYHLIARPSGKVNKKIRQIQIED